MHGGSSYGLWSLVIINSAIFAIFAFSFTKPKTSRDWRSLGVFSAFIVALFTEMYGFLLQWPTLPTLIMFPILVYVYVQFAKREERDALALFAGEYENYMNGVPGFVPGFKLGIMKT